MYYITQLQRPSFELGKKEGERKGKKEGKKTGISITLSRLIAKKFDTQVRRVSPRLRNLTSEDLIELTENIFGFNSLDSVNEWIKQRKQKTK